MNLEDCIKDLSPELQEKARACGSVEELLALAKEEKVPVPDEALATIAGGDQPDPENCKPVAIKCPKCGSTNTEFCCEINMYLCNDCGATWLS